MIILSRRWLIRQYGTVLDDFLVHLRSSNQALDQDTQAHLHALQEKGNLLGMPMSESLGDGIFQLRPHTDEVQARLLYFFGKTERGEPKAVFTNIFTKKTRKTPKEEIDLAKSRRNELQEQERANKERTRKHRSGGHDGRTYH